MASTIIFPLQYYKFHTVFPYFFLPGPVKLIEWKAFPQNFSVQYNSTFEIYVLTLGLPLDYPDLEIFHFETQNWSSSEAHKTLTFHNGYMKPHAQYTSMRCSFTGYHRFVANNLGYIFKFPQPLHISGMYSRSSFKIILNFWKFKIWKKNFKLKIFWCCIFIKVK